MEGEWRKNIDPRLLLGLVLIPWTISVVNWLIPGHDGMLALIFSLFCTLALVPVLYGLRQNKDMLYSAYRSISLPDPGLPAAIEAVLRKAGRMPASRGARGGGKSTNLTWDITGGLNVTLHVHDGNHSIWVGPDRPRTRTDVEAVKGIIDRLLDT